MESKENKGFTLIELIVVVIIVTVLIGVTIVGLMTYVNKARINTDLNNASELQKELPSALLVSKRMFIDREDFMPGTHNVDESINDGNLVVIYHWVYESKVDYKSWSDGGSGYWFYDKNGDKAVTADWGAYNAKKLSSGHVAAGAPLLKTLYDMGCLKNLPLCQSNGTFVMIIYFDENGLYKHNKVIVCSKLGDSDKIKLSEDGYWYPYNYKYYAKKYEPNW